MRDISMLPLPERARIERIKGNVFGIIVSFIASLSIAAILVFGFQNGLAVTDRCHCSWQKVIIFSVVSFIAYLTQIISYEIYDRKWTQISTANNPNVVTNWTTGGQVKHFIISTVLFAAIPVVIVYLVVPFIADQNRNFLWFFQNGFMGILCVVVSFIESAVIGVFQKLLFTKQIY